MVISDGLVGILDDKTFRRKAAISHENIVSSKIYKRTFLIVFSQVSGLQLIRPWFSHVYDGQCGLLAARL